MKRRPGGITALATVYLLLGLFSLLWSGLVFGIGGLSAATGWLFGQESIQAMGGASLASGFVGLLGAGLQIFTAIGLFGMKRWGWFLALISAGITLLQGALGLFSGGFFGFLCGAIWLIVPALIFFYLLKPDVRAAFNYVPPAKTAVLEGQAAVWEEPMLVEKSPDPDSFPPGEEPAAGEG